MLRAHTHTLMHEWKKSGREREMFRSMYQIDTEDEENFRWNQSKEESGRQATKQQQQQQNAKRNI